ncbi:MAG: heavy metal translocating P-type ATPase metal-binding domain-containing protein [Bacteroidetes bacterium]|nr:heavy metal translocating P-type ATPase metal-binding domain-containing protein [Bacteroidota bacterium]
MHSDNSCTHCGADCGKSPILWKEYIFCCNGCLQVYQLLNEYKLQQYYTLAKVPGIKAEDEAYEGKYGFLDKDEIKNKLYEFHENNLAKVSFYIPVIHCISCIWLLEHLNKLNAGINQSSVNFVKKTCTITFNTDEISLRQVVELLHSIHYIPDISLQLLEGKTNKKQSNALTYKIGIAGFIAGNVMLFSLPLYFNGKPLDGFLGTFFSYISFLLTLPLVFYCGSDYLISAWKALRKKMVNIDLPIALGILCLFTVTTYEVISKTGQGYSDSLSGLLFFLLIGKWYQSKTYEALSFDRDYKSYFPIAVTKITDSGEKTVLLKDIQVDDLLLIRNKELIPADALLVDGVGLIDYSFVSGESTPIRKESGDSLYAGGIQIQGAVTIKVTKEVSQSNLTQLWNQSEMNRKPHKQLLPLIDRISLIFTLVIISMAVGGFLYWWLQGEFHTAVLVFTSVLIVTCPCALALSLPFSLGNSMRLLGQQGVYIKNTQIIEKLIKIDTIVFDKTGTITVPDQNNITYSGKMLTADEIIAVASLAKQSTHPLSQALSKYFNETDCLTVHGFVEVSGKGTYALVNGHSVRLGSAAYLGIVSKEHNSGAAKVYIELNKVYCGYFTIGNKYRKGFLDVAANLRQNYRLYLLSGDNPSEKEFLKSYFDEASMLFEQTPRGKMDFIKNLQENGHNVMMAGDGLNDAGAFMQSDVAVSVADDIYHFSPAGDIIIEAAKFNTIKKVIAFSKLSLNVVKLSFVISFLYNIFGLIYALSGTMSPVVAAILMPISSVTVVAFAIFGTRVVAGWTINKNKLIF